MSLVDSNGFDEMERRTTGDGSSLYHQQSYQTRWRAVCSGQQPHYSPVVGQEYWLVPPQECGGLGWTDLQLPAIYLRLGRSLTTAFIATQWQAACRRIMLFQRCASRPIGSSLAKGELFTSGISHLTTSKQHLAVPPQGSTYRK